MKIALIMSTEVGLRTQFLNWKRNFPEDMGLDPTWITITFERSWVQKLPGLPGSVRSRLAAAIELNEGLKQGPFEATFVAVHSALASRVGYSAKNACFQTFDVTPKQLYAFGDFYGKYPSRLAAVEKAKHEARAREYRTMRGLFPWSRWAAGSVVSDYGADSKRVHIMPPGVTISDWQTEPRAGEGPCNILFVGGHFLRKGGDLLLEWARTTNLQGWKLHLVTRDSIEVDDTRIRVYNGLSSNDPELMNLYRQADVFALPTKADCYSIAGIEAMAAGLPLVLGHSGGTGDVVKENETGFLVEPGDRDALHKALTALISNRELRRRMGSLAQVDAQARYDARTNVRNTLQIIKETL